MFNQGYSLGPFIILVKAAGEVVNEGLVAFRTTELHEAHARLFKGSIGIHIHLCCLLEMLSLI